MFQSVFSLFFAMSSFAVFAFASNDIAGIDSMIGGQPQTCGIQFVNAETQKILGQCSGVLTSKTEVTTAGHCVSHMIKNSKIYARVGCGSTSAGRFIELFESRDAAVHQEYSSETSKNAKDIGLITLPHASKLDPIEKVITASIETFLKSPNLDCRAEGFGRDESFNSGVLKHIELKGLFTDQNLVKHQTLISRKYGAARNQTRELQKLLVNEESKYAAIQALFEDHTIRATTFEGDSGGPLFCREKGRTWKLVALNLGATFKLFEDEPNDLTQLFFEQLWTKVQP